MEVLMAERIGKDQLRRTRAAGVPCQQCKTRDQRIAALEAEREEIVADWQAWHRELSAALDCQFLKRSVTLRAVKDLIADTARLREENAENVLILRRELSVIMDAIYALPESMLNQIPEGKLVVALKAMDDAEKQRDVRCYIDDVKAENERLRDHLNTILVAEHDPGELCDADWNAARAALDEQGGECSCDRSVGENCPACYHDGFDAQGGTDG